MGRLFYVVYVILITNSQFPLNLNKPVEGAQCKFEDSLKFVQIALINRLLTESRTFSSL